VDVLFDGSGFWCYAEEWGLGDRDMSMKNGAFIFRNK